MIAAQHDALVALLGTAGPTVHDGLVPDKPALPYVVLWSTSPQRSATRLCGVQADASTTTFATTVVALSAADVVRVQQRVHDVLIDAMVPIVGRQVQRVKHVDSAQAEPDFDVDPPVVTVVDVWRLFTVPL